MSSPTRGAVGRLLVAVQTAECRRIISFAPTAKRIASLGLFVFDNFRPHVRQQLRSKGAGHVTCRFHDFDSRECTAHWTILSVNNWLCVSPSVAARTKSRPWPKNGNFDCGPS